MWKTDPAFYNPFIYEKFEYQRVEKEEWAVQQEKNKEEYKEKLLGNWQFPSFGKRKKKNRKKPWI